MFHIGTKEPTVPGLALMIIPWERKPGESPEEYTERLSRERRFLLLLGWN